MIYPLVLIEALKEGFVGVLLTLDTIIYNLISSAFKVFMTIAGARLLSSDTYFEIANKIYVVVGVLMLFVLSYAILRGIIDPDQATKGELGPKTVKNVIIAVVGLAIAPVLFNLMYQAQGLILEQDILGKIFFRMENTEKISTGGSVDVGEEKVTFDSEVNPDEYVKVVGGSATATNLWQAFFYPSEDSGKDASEIEASASGLFLSAGANALGCAGALVAATAVSSVPVVGWLAGGVLAVGAGVTVCASAVTDAAAGTAALTQTDGDITLEEAYAYAAGGGNFTIFTVFLKNYADEGEITYLFGISTIAGAFALYAFVSFSIDMGVRAAKLAYLQIIAPVPLVMQVLPKFKDNFSTYTKNVVSTFMEVFIRISVVYVVVYIICHLTELFSSIALWGNNNGLNTAEQLLALALLILGLIAFCREAPKIISDSLKLSTGNVKLGIGKKLADGGFYAGKSIIGGGLKAGVRNWTSSQGAPTGRRARAFLSGVGSGAVRATWMNIGPGHKPAETWKQSNDITENAAQAANDKHDETVKRRERLAAAREAYHQAVENENQGRSRVTAAEAALTAAIASGNQTAIDAAQADYNAAMQELETLQKAVQSAHKEVLISTAIGNTVDKIGERVTAWTTGTVSTEQEEADIAFANAMKKARADARDIAYAKGDNATKALKQRLDQLESEKISEYKDGWDEESYNAAIRQRVQTELNDLQAKQAIKANMQNDVNTAQQDLDAAIAAGASQTEINLKRSALTTAQNNLTTATNDEQAAITTLNTARQNVIAEVDAIAKLSDSELAEKRIKLQQEIKATKDSLEASADAYIAREIGKHGSDVHKLYQNLLSTNASYISKNASRKIDIDGNGTMIAIRNVLETSFGEGVVATNTINTAFASAQNQFTFKYKDANGNEHTRTYTYDNGQYVADDGTQSYNEDVFFSTMNQLLIAQPGSELKAKTSSSKLADAGKNAATAIETSAEYIAKMRRKREAQQNKNK